MKGLPDGLEVFPGMVEIQDLDRLLESGLRQGP